MQYLNFCQQGAIFKSHFQFNKFRQKIFDQSKIQSSKKSFCKRKKRRDGSILYSNYGENPHPNKDKLQIQQLKNQQIAQALLLPLGMINVQKLFKDAYKEYIEFKDKVFYGEAVPQVDEGLLSFANFLKLMKDKKVKRINLLADGRLAVVEIPNPGFATNYDEIRYDPKNIKVLYGEENKEWKIERLNFIVEMPGDLWENTDFMNILKQNIPHRTADNKVKFEWLLTEHQVHNELTVKDPADVYKVLNEISNDVAIVSLLLFIQFTVPPIIRIFGYSKRDKKQEAMEKLMRSRAVEYNVRKTLLSGIKDTTGVRFKDVAGLDQIKGEIEEITKMMLGDKQFTKLGAKIPKGILMEGPPGNGKTYLAKAMAGEVALPFYSENGSQFVEMFSGIAASRVTDLFNRARKNAPSIIFIDEIDAIGKKRSENSVDPGQSEGEAGLLKLLVEMDGVQSGKDQILVMAATNRVDALDDALLRPGRFDRKIYVGNPTEPNRYEILKVHSQNKKVESDHILREAAKLTQGYSSSTLANLLNEAAILTVRKNKEMITLQEIEEVMERFEVGLAGRNIPYSKAKKRFSQIIAAKAIASALTPGLPHIQYVTIKPSGTRSSGRIVFQPGFEGSELYQRQILNVEEKINSVELQEPLGAFEYNCEQMLPLMVGRAFEEVFFPPDEISLLNQPDLEKATQLAYWLTSQSSFHPLMLNMVDRYVAKDNKEICYQLSRFLLDAAHLRAVQFVKKHEDIINEISERLIAAEDQKISGQVLIDTVDQYYQQDKYKQKEEPLFKDFSEEEFDEQFQGVSPQVRDQLKQFIKGQEGAYDGEKSQYKFDLDEILKMSLVVSGQIPVQFLLGETQSSFLAKRELFKDFKFEQKNKDRQIQMRQFATDFKADFPPPPPPQVIGEWQRRRAIDYNTFNIDEGTTKE